MTVVGSLSLYMSVYICPLDPREDKVQKVNDGMKKKKRNAVAGHDKWFSFHYDTKSTWTQRTGIFEFPSGMDHLSDSTWRQHYLLIGSSLWFSVWLPHRLNVFCFRCSVITGMIWLLPNVWLNLTWLSCPNPTTIIGELFVCVLMCPTIPPILQ